MISNRRALGWLLDSEHRWLWVPETKREVMRLLVSLAPKLEQDLLAELEQAILAGPPRALYGEGIDPEYWRRYRDMNIWFRLAKMEEAGADLSEIAKDQLKDISSQHPEWELSEDQRDEFSFRVSEGDEATEFTTTPSTLPELIKWLKQNPGTDGLQRDDWRQRCRDNFALTSDALCALAKENHWCSVRWRDALRAWSEEKRFQESWEKLAWTLVKVPEDVFPDLVRYVSLWLRDIAKVLDGQEEYFFELVERILSSDHENVKAANVEIVNFDNEDDEHRKDPVGEAINHPIGHATEALIFWWYRQSLRDNLGLDEKVRSIFTELCNIEIKKYRHSRVFLADNVITIFRVDPKWTHENLLPLFSWKSSQEAYLAWRSFLWTPRLYLPLMDALKADFLDTAEPDHYGDLGDHSSQYADFLTFLALDAGETFTKKELAKAIKKLPKEGLSRSAQTLWEVLEGSREQRRDCWQNRIVPYIQDIWPQDNQGVDPEISENLGRLCIAAEENFPEAFDLLRSWLGAIRTDHSYQIDALNDSGLCKNHPDKALEFLDLIVKNEIPYLPVDQLRSCLDAIRDEAPHLKKHPQYVRLNTLARQHGGG